MFELEQIKGELKAELAQMGPEGCWETNCKQRLW